MSAGPEKVFISYAHESPELRGRVRDLCDRLRTDGWDCLIDRHDDAPREGWAHWMERQIVAATYVLLVCTEEYLRRFDGEAPAGTGKGVKWEGSLIRKALYRAERINTTFIPVTFGASDEFVPFVLSDTTHYDVSEEAGYQSLYRRLAGQPDVVPTPIGTRREVPTAQAGTTVRFADAVEPDRVSLAGAAEALAAGANVAVVWPSSTEEPYATFRERHARLREFLTERGFEDDELPSHIEHWRMLMDPARLHHDYAARRLPVIWAEAAGTGLDQAAAFVTAAFGYLVLCNVRILTPLRHLHLRDEADLVPPEFEDMATFLGSVAARAAFDTTEPFYGIDTYVGDRGPVEVWAPASVAARVRRSGYSPDDVAAWVMPWWELGLVGTRSLADYGPAEIFVGKVVTEDRWPL
jgi:hypothetical protein